MKPDQNLLFCIIALQMDFIQQEQFATATSLWLLDKSRSIEEILVEQGAISDDDCKILCPLVARHLTDHDGDLQKSLAALGDMSSMIYALESLTDDNVDETISLITERLKHKEYGDARSNQAHHAAKTKDGGKENYRRFQVVRPLAKGGLGEVFIANDNELNREVALKEIQSQFADNTDSRLRFLLEAEVTGGLEHPGIVPVYGLGQYDDGRPFYAMRFIKGDSLKEASDRFHRAPANQKPTEGNEDSADRESTKKTKASDATVDFDGVDFRKLLGRFVDVCQAIEYAHSRGVLHRDLKPGNIMLGKYGETLVVDWGLAKVKDKDESEVIHDENTLIPKSGSGSTNTLFGSAIGTPAFMPPEQAAGRLEELGPTSDVYSLGATLFYMLVGKSPFRSRDVNDLLLKVQNGEFEAPVLVNRSVPKPLSAICLKAMSTRPADRYASTSDLADDIEKWMADEAVSVYREPLTKRIGRWTKKHRLLVSNVTAASLVGIAALFVSTILLKSANDKLTSANNQINAEIIKVRDAQETTLAINSFLTDDLLEQADPELNPYRDKTTVVQLLNRAAKKIESAESLKGRPKIESSIRFTIGKTYYALGKYREATTHLDLALSLERKLADKSPVALMERLHSLVQCNLMMERLPEVETQVNELIELTERYCDSSDALLPRSKILKSQLLLRQANYKASEELATSTLAATEEMHGPKTDIANECRTNLASILSSTLKDYDRAMKLHQDSLQYLFDSGAKADSAEVFVAKGQLAEALGSYGKAEESKTLMMSVVKAQEKILPRDHALALNSRIGLAVILTSLREYGPAAGILKEALAAAESSLGPDHYLTWLAREHTSSLLVAISSHVPRSARRLDEAVNLCRRDLETCKYHGWNAAHTDGFLTRWNLINALQKNQKKNEVKELLNATLKEVEEAKGEVSLEGLTLGIAIADTNGRAGAKESEKNMEPLLKFADTELPKLHNAAAFGFGTMGNIKLALGKNAESEKHFLRFFDYCQNSEQALPEFQANVLTALAKISINVSNDAPLEKIKFEQGKHFRIKLNVPDTLATMMISQGFSRTVEVNNVKTGEAFQYFAPTSSNPVYNLRAIPLGCELDNKTFELEITEGKMVDQYSFSGKLDDDSPLDELQLNFPRGTNGIELEAGLNYQFEIQSDDFAPFVRLETDREKVIQSDQSNRKGLVKFSVTPRTSGKYHLVVLAKKIDSKGAYDVNVKKFESVGTPRVLSGSFEKPDPN